MCVCVQAKETQFAWSCLLLKQCVMSVGRCECVWVCGCGCGSVGRCVGVGWVGVGGGGWVCVGVWGYTCGGIM